MALIKSISGIRGTIGGKPGDSLSPLDIVHFTSAFATLIRSWRKKEDQYLVVGRDARISGEMVSRLVTGTLSGMGINVIDLGLATTPTVEMAVKKLNADGGIIITASHNPANWNALKLLNDKGEFISAAEGKTLLERVAAGDYAYAEVERIGTITENHEMNRFHIEEILSLGLVDKKSIVEAGLKVVVDCVNSVGGLVIPDLLKALGVSEVIGLYTSPTGIFPHNPEPLPDHLKDIAEAVVKHKADVGFVVDPDVDRLAIVCEDGSMFGEEYTLVAAADYVLKAGKGNTVSNLSSSQALRDVTQQYGGTWSAAAVGEVNVVAEMKRTQAVIGGEGNGGVIYPPLHYGRDALVGIALFLSHLTSSGKTCAGLRKTYPDYYISKNKIELSSGQDMDALLEHVRQKYRDADINDTDGIKIVFPREWVHLRKSNTEPIIRIISESISPERASQLSQQVMNDVNALISGDA